MPRPICFMIMPYSTKPTGAPADSGGPDKVNFDRLWEAALRPAIDHAGYEPVRANEDIGALIIEQMIERLAISDLVLADISIPNGNVYYEIGIRHAAKEKGCIMTSANWSKPLFDIDQMRRITYPLPAESISDETAAEIVKIIQGAILSMSEGESPFYQVFPKYPQYEPARATSFREALKNSRAFRRRSLRRAPPVTSAGPAPSISERVTTRAGLLQKRWPLTFSIYCATVRIGRRRSSSQTICRATCETRHSSRSR